jgi:hypothetical protein
MSRVSRVLQVIAVAIIFWFGLHACSTMQGEPAPTLVPGELVGAGPIGAKVQMPIGGWKLLAFFGPD